MCALAASTTLLAFAVTPWQLYAAYVLMAFGWAGMGAVVIATVLRFWFDRRSGLAISLALNGATCGGIIVARRWFSSSGQSGSHGRCWR
jgi:MFS family permease